MCVCCVCVCCVLCVWEGGVDHGVGFVLCYSVPCFLSALFLFFFIFIFWIACTRALHFLSWIALFFCELSSLMTKTTHNSSSITFLVRRNARSRIILVQWNRHTRMKSGRSTSMYSLAYWYVLTVHTGMWSVRTRTILGFYQNGTSTKRKKCTSTILGVYQNRTAVQYELRIVLVRTSTIPAFVPVWQLVLYQYELKVYCFIPVYSANLVPDRYQYQKRILERYCTHTVPYCTHFLTHLLRKWPQVLGRLQVWKLTCDPENRTVPWGTPLATDCERVRTGPGSNSSCFISNEPEQLY